VKEAADLGTLLLGVSTKLAREFGAEVAVGEALHGVLSAHEGDEELGIGPGHGIEGLKGSARRRVLAGGDGVQPPEAGDGIVDLGQRIEIPPVALLRDLAVAEEEIAGTEAAIGCAMFFPADMLATVGFLDSRYFLLYEDSDWCFRGKSAGYRCLMVPKAHVWHKVSATIRGSDSPLPRYFTTRNRLLWAERHLPLGQRLRVWLTTLAEMLEPWSAALEVVSLALGRRNLRQAYWASRGLRKEIARFRGSAHRRGLRDAYRLGVWHYMLRRFGDCPTHLRSSVPPSSRPVASPPH